ncbi:hypothetical protein Ddye_010150 [Dipteronia dyeriana]|uniref:Alpha 1,4-glycosyltransferase domain-containing protein n=1 Tax=Dipteronia dyeriana TaxID=168575 RepID=A0AAD9XDR8_9ROSI|nr:hypothetical protein Ddye_010150 [Dipteronia dyeriana]
MLVTGFTILNQTFKSPIFSTTAFAAIFFLVYSDRIITNLSVYPADIRISDIFEAPQTPDEVFEGQQTSKKILEAPQTPKIEAQVQSTSNTVPLLKTQQNIEENNMPLPTRQEKVKEKSQSMFTMQQRIQENSRPLLTTQAMNEGDGETPDPLIPPKDVTREERMEWFGTLLKSNPQACLMIISRSLDTGYGYRILKPLLDLGFKVLAVTPDLPFLVKDTSSEVWLEEMKCGTKDPGHIPLSNNLSNLIRLAMLYKYGGAYLDTDFIILKDFPGLRNVVGAQIDWVKILRLFKKPETVEESKWVEDMMLQLSSSSYALHLWNKRTRALTIKEGSVMERLIADHCTNISQTIRYSIDHCDKYTKQYEWLEYGSSICGSNERTDETLNEKKRRIAKFPECKNHEYQQ